MWFGFNQALLSNMNTIAKEALFISVWSLLANQYNTYFYLPMYSILRLSLLYALNLTFFYSFWEWLVLQVHILSKTATHHNEYNGKECTCSKHNVELGIAVHFYMSWYVGKVIWFLHSDAIVDIHQEDSCNVLNALAWGDDVAAFWWSEDQMLS